MNFELTAEQRELQAIARTFAYEEIQPRARELDRVADPAAAYPEDLVRRADALGLRLLKVPRAFGGREADGLTEAIVLEELCVGDVGFGTLLAHPWREGLMLATATTEDQRERFLKPFLSDPSGVTALCITEPHCGSDSSTPYCGDLNAGPRTTAVRDGDVWIINGRKHFITAGNRAGVLFVIARTNPHVPWPQGISVILVPGDAPGFRCERVQDKLGVRVNPNTELVFNNCRVPAANLVGQVNGGAAVLARFGPGSKTKEGVKSLGIARAAFEAADRWARERVQGGKPLIEHQVIAHTLADVAGQIELCRTLLWRAAWSIDHDRAVAPKLEAMAKVAATRMAADVAVRALEIFGGWGILRENPIEKLVRDATAMLHAFVGNSAMQENLATILRAEAPATPRLALARA
jgi:alkylation response protein AidB-like acyl-CoA dehydrogenase